MAALSGCADDRLPLSECTYGRYWASCGGNTEPVFACDEATTECRWFLGGETARGHAVSPCPAGELCCVDGGRSPFSGWSPPRELLDSTRRSVGLGAWVVSAPSMPHDVDVVFDHAGTSEEVVVVCEGRGPHPLDLYTCDSTLRSGRRVRLSGGSLVAGYPGAGLPETPLDERVFAEVEVLPSGDTYRARVYVHRYSGSMHEPTRRLCTGQQGSVVPVDTGILHLSPGAFADPENAHGLFEGVVNAAGEYPTSFSIEF